MDPVDPDMSTYDDAMAALDRVRFDSGDLPNGVMVLAELRSGDVVRPVDVATALKAAASRAADPVLRKLVVSPTGWHADVAAACELLRLEILRMVSQ